MQKNELENILLELYRWNPKLKGQEHDLIKLIEQMAASKPDSKFDQSFAESLKKDLLSHRILLDEPEDNKLLFNFINMNKKIYVATGVLSAICLVALIIVPGLFSEKKQMGQLAKTNNEFVKAAPGAFGSLLAVNANPVDSATSAKTLASGSESSSLGSRSASSVAVAPMASAGAGVSSPDAVSSRTVSSKMMAPLFSYNYAYKGDPLTLGNETGVVYRRIKGDGNLTGNLDSLVSTETFGPLNLSTFSGLQTNSISLAENKRLGLIINIDFNEENIYIGENWQYWQSDRDKCGEDQACWDSYRLKIGDIPDDASLIQQTDKFLNDRGINLEHYGKPQVDNNWRTDFEKSQDKQNYYIPESSNVVYPLIVNGENVYDQSGNLDGLHVSVNLLQNSVSGLSNLNSFRYETSDYNLETQSDKILGLAQNGGYSYSNYYGDTQEKISLDLGTPTEALVRFTKYSNNVNDELLIPALIFPVTNAPANYYGSKFVVVPLVKEMVDELINQKNNINNPIPYSTPGSGPINIMVR